MTYEYICNQVAGLRKKYPGYTLKEILDAKHIIVLYQSLGTDPDAIKLIADAVEQEMYPYISSLLPDTAIAVIEPAVRPTSPINTVAKSSAFTRGFFSFPINRKFKSGTS